MILTTISLTGCATLSQGTLDGHWRAVWMTSGGEVPVDMYLRTSGTGQLEAEVHNVTEVIRFNRVQRTGNHLDFYLDRYDCHIGADLAADELSMRGLWTKEAGRHVETPFFAEKGQVERFPKDKYPAPEAIAPMADVSGTWRIRFEGDTYDSMGIFAQKGEKVTGTIRAMDGDFRFLEGVYRNGLLLLSHANGCWSFIMRARMDESGKLHGYWARGPREPIKWTGSKEEADFPDTFDLTRLTNQEGLFRFRYPLADDPKRFLSGTAPEFQGKPLLVGLTTTGCPNSHDSADLLSQMYEEYHEKGLNIIAISFEMTKDLGLVQSRLRRYKEQHKLPIPVLFSTAMTKAEVKKEIPDLEQFLAWPTVVFIGPDGKVDSIHTGIDGPATGQHYQKLVSEYRRRIEAMLAKMKK